MPTSVRLTTDLEARLDALAARTGRTKAFYIREAVEEHLDDLEDLYQAEEAIGRLRRGESRTYTLEEMERELGLDD